MTTYDANLFEPPAPVARVILRNPDTGMMWSDVPMLIDCGADVTMVPEAILTRLNAGIIPNIEIELFDFPYERHPRTQKNHRPRH